jgi:hypothetical protein
MESVFIAIGLISIMSVVTLADSLASAPAADATALAVSGNSLVDTYEWAFQWGPGLVAGIGNGLMLGYLMYRSALVPPRMALLGLIGGSLLILSIAYFSVGWIGARRTIPLLEVGVMWLVLMVVFEISFGLLVVGASWQRLLSDYNILQGGLLPVGLAVLALSPLIVASARHLHR